MSDDFEPPRERPNPKDEDKDGRDDKAKDEDNIFTGEKFDIPKMSNPKDEDKDGRDDKAEDEDNDFAALDTSLDDEIATARRRAERDKFTRDSKIETARQKEEEAKFDRARVFDNSLARWKRFVLWAAFGIVFGTALVTILWIFLPLFVFIWHLMIPGAGWLDQEQLDQLRQFLLILHIDTFPPQMPE